MSLITPEEKTEKFINNFLQRLDKVYTFVDGCTEELACITRGLSYEQNLQILCKSPIEPNRSRTEKEIQEYIQTESAESDPPLSENEFLALRAADEVKRLLFREIYGNAQFDEGNCTSIPLQTLMDSHNNAFKFLLSNPLSHLSKSIIASDSPLVKKIKEIKLGWIYQQYDLKSPDLKELLKKLSEIDNNDEEKVKDLQQKIQEEYQKSKTTDQRSSFLTSFLKTLVMALSEDERYVNPANPNQLVRKMEKIAPQFMYKTDNNHNLTAVFSEHNIKRGALVIVVLKKKEGFDKENMSPEDMTHGHMLVCTGFEEQADGTIEPLYTSFDYERRNHKLSEHRKKCGYVIDLAGLVQKAYEDHQKVQFLSLKEKFQNQ